MITGLTGGIASGKSTVSKILSDHGAFIIDADIVAREVVAPKTTGLAMIVENFGQEMLIAETGELNRKKLGKVVFQSKKKLEKMNKILQPLIRQEIKKQIDEAKKQYQWIVVDIPLLYEQGYESLFDEVIVVTVNRKTQLKRLCQRDQISEEEAFQRIHAQLDLTEKEKRADIVIDNSKDLSCTMMQIESWLETSTHLTENI